MFHASNRFILIHSIQNQFQLSASFCDLSFIHHLKLLTQIDRVAMEITEKKNKVNPKMLDYGSGLSIRYKFMRRYIYDVINRTLNELMIWRNG